MVRQVSNGKIKDQVTSQFCGDHSNHEPGEEVIERGKMIKMEE